MKIPICKHFLSMKYFILFLLLFSISMGISLKINFSELLEIEKNLQGELCGEFEKL